MGIRILNLMKLKILILMMSSNESITEEDVLNAIRALKNGKAYSKDLILNEFLKTSQELMLPLYTKHFNMIFESGRVPEIWAEGYIIIYKNKGEILNPDNYRGITILSCMGKLFTSVLNNKLNDYLSNYEILGEEQAGFRKMFW